ncbi:death-associated protein kinase 1-like isoform X4 [Biomphalaria glabrata]|uniref:Death-associated protein kinase 1-like isoform X4 n=1 Tax=Biomphalaria glabrata TaxID=6526 RepID=A0A9W2Z509_BIOGL|nr:death-associated protein kinase 1-like isoform X4 [Biomphalaria glabrata]XP_055870006.1 death-associated protein kinase 1-like isoform X4 [Biomphalaria glabrata]XP_055870011.1 death-associated protein kinase 1-like isoform X4 [Biomphalaria glabrata]
MQMGAFDLMPRKTAAIYLSTGSIANSSGGSNTPRTSSSSSGHAGHHYGELWRSKNFSFGPRSPRSISSSSLEDRLSTASPSLRSYSPCLNTSKLPHGRVALSDVRPKDRLFLSGELLVPDSEGSLYDGRLFYSSEYLFPGHRHHLRTRPYASFLDSDTQGIEEKRSLQGIVASEEELTLSTIFQDKAENFVMAALFCASEEGNVEGLKELSEMAANIDFNTANKHGETAVHMAASGGHVDVLKFLLSKGVDISIRDKQGDNAIYWAARQGHTDIIKCLVEAGVPISTQNKSGETALHVAARYGHTSTVEYLCSIEANINLFDNLGETPLHCAAWHGYVQIVHILCESGALLTLQNKEKETALHCAAVRGNVDCVRVLLEYGAPLNHTDKRGSTALHLACQRHNMAIALLILNAGCKLDILDKETGETAFHCAAREGLLSVVQTMCSLGIDVNIETADSWTALHLACKYGHIEIVRCLLLVGADPDKLNKEGLTGEILALAQGFTNISDLMSLVKGERRMSFITQLKPNPQPISRVKLKLLGSTGVGKSVLVESLKCTYLSSFFRRRLQPAGHTNSVKQRNRNKLSRQFSLPTPLNYIVGNPTYTKGVDIQVINIAGNKEFSVWEFSGYEPYYMLYDYFLGDVNCIHIVLFNLEDSLDEQMAQVIFWLNFLKARIHPKMPIDHCGKLQNTAQVILVATHSDKSISPCHKNSQGNLVNDEAKYILDKVTTMFQYDLDICPQIFILDATSPSSNDMRSFKQQLIKTKEEISQKLPCSNGLLSAVVAQLPEWRKAFHSYPVLSWLQFTEHIRGSVNPLASEEDIKLLDRQLQLMGEIVYLHSQTDLVVLNPQWLGSEVLGNLLSHERISQARVTGCFTLDEFQLMYPNTDALSLIQVLEALELCSACEVDEEVEYEFPCLNFVEALDGLWVKDDERFPNQVYGGVRLHTSFQSGAQLKYLFPRIQVCLRRSILSGEEEDEAENSDDEAKGKELKDADLYQWHHGSKYCCARLEGIIDMDKNEQYLEIKVRGPEGERANLYYFLEDFVNIIEQVVENVCPGLCVERYTLSPMQLKQHGKVVRSYSPTELLRMQMDNRSSVVLSGNIKEDFIDIACLGSEEILETVTLGMDLPISHLTIHTQRLLSLLLDPPEAMGKDWCLLAVTLGLSDAIPSLEPSESEATCVSQTQKVLQEWTRRKPDASIRHLVSKLKEIGRVDAVEAILRTGPPFKVLSFEDQMTEGSGGTQGTNASTNTLSNLSR